MLLFLRAVVGRLTLRINAAYVADVNAVVVVAFHAVGYFFNWPIVNYLAVPFDDEMVTGRTPVKHLTVVSVNAVSRCLYVAGCCVQNDVVNWSHCQMGVG